MKLLFFATQLLLSCENISDERSRSENTKGSRGGAAVPDRSEKKGKAQAKSRSLESCLLLIGAVFNPAPKTKMVLHSQEEWEGDGVCLGHVGVNSRRCHQAPASASSSLSASLA